LSRKFCFEPIVPISAIRLPNLSCKTSLPFIEQCSGSR
jgi:hypothetical protein